MSTTQPSLSIRDIARRCGVSPGTVSNVINGRDVVKPKTATRIRALMNELNYAPRSKAVNTNRVMLLLPPHHDALLSSHLAAMHAGVCETAFNHNIVLSMQRCPENLNSANQLRDMLREDGSSGIILLASTHGYHMADTLALSQTPHMVVGASRHQRDVNQIILDDEASAYHAARYLQTLGHKRIAMIYFNRDDIGHAQRYVGFAAACKPLRMAPELVEGVETSCIEPEYGARALKQLMQLPKPPTALIITNSQLTHGVLMQAAQMGLSIPDDLSLITYQSMPKPEFGLHTVTSMNTPAYEMGVKAIESIGRMLDEPSLPDTAPLTLEMAHTLQVRQSTTSPRDKG